MPIIRPRISMDEEFWNTFVSMCRQLHVDPSTYIERSLRSSMLPFADLQALNAAQVATINKVTEIHESINVLGDFIADRAAPIDDADYDGDLVDAIADN